MHHGLRTLAELNIGDSAIVQHIGCDRPMARRLMEMGLLPGTRLLRRWPPGLFPAHPGLRRRPPAVPRPAAAPPPPGAAPAARVGGVLSGRQIAAKA